MPVQLRDVAKRLKFSITTVSRALDGFDDVAAPTRARVLRAAREMEYVPSRAARQLRRNRSDVIGHVLPAFAGHFADSFSTAAADSVIEKRIYIRWVRSRFVDGIVLSRMRLRDWRVAHLVTTHVPFVAHGRTLTRGKYPYREVDSRSGFEELVRHPVQRGFRRIAHIGAPPEITPQAERFAGYRNGLASAGIAFEEFLVVEGDLTRQGGYMAAQRRLALRTPPAAIMGANHLTAIGAIRAAHERGLKVWKDLAVVGYNGTEDAAYSQPPLTTLQQPIYDAAKRLVDILVACINGEPLTHRPTAEGCDKMQKRSRHAIQNAHHI